MLRILATLALVAGFSSCASIVTGSEDAVQILTTPPGASFTTNTGHQGTTPSTISIPDEVNLQVDLALDGYHPQRVMHPRKASPWILGNILFGGIIGLVIDVASGNMHTHGETVEVTLVPLSEPKPEEINTSPKKNSEARTKTLGGPRAEL